MAKTGFGQTNSNYAFYAFDFSRSGKESNIAWPAQNTPIEFFQDYHPWSITTGNEEDISKVKVTLKRASDNATWTFSENNSSDGYFNVNNLGYGQRGCIIFRPTAIKYNADDVFDVTITGTSKGTIKYKVSFFVLYPDETVALSQATVYTKYKSYEYTGYNRKPVPVVKIGNKKLVSGTDYTVTYKNNKKIGKATITISGLLKNRGYITCDFDIVAGNISKGTATTKYPTYDYTGKKRQPAMILKVGSRTLVKNRDYTLTYKNNKNIGTATVTAKGIGNYTGTKSCTFKIVKKQTIVPVYRLYNRGTGEHFYTSSTAERQAYLNAGGWTSEGIAWYSPKTSSEPIYRLSNPNGGNDHHYTKSKSERDWLVSLGWKYDCIAWYSDMNQAVPVYRHYTPYQKTGNHHYTTSKGESDYIVKYAGWKYEGISFYVSKAGG